MTDKVSLSFSVPAFVAAHVTSEHVAQWAERWPRLAASKQKKARGRALELYHEAGYGAQPKEKLNVYVPANVSLLLHKIGWGSPSDGFRVLYCASDYMTTREPASRTKAWLMVPLHTDLLTPLGENPSVDVRATYAKAAALLWSTLDETQRQQAMEMERAAAWRNRRAHTGTLTVPFRLEPEDMGKLTGGKTSVVFRAALRRVLALT